MIQGGWVCRACWKSNRPQDDRCYRCKTPREEQLTVEAGSLKEQTAPGYALRNRLDAKLGILAAVVAWPTWLTGWLGIIGGVLVFLLALLTLVTGREVNALVIGITAVVVVLVSWFWIFLANSIRRNARWAYAVAAVVYIVPSAPWLLGIVDVPPGIVLPDWYSTMQTVFALLGLVLGICAAVLLIASFMSEDGAEGSPSTEAG